MTIGEVKGKLKALGVDLTGVIEKEELIKLARQHGVLKKVAAPKKADANAATPAARQTPKVLALLQLLTFLSMINGRVSIPLA